jgi:hypothetical protein
VANHRPQGILEGADIRGPGVIDAQQSAVVRAPGAGAFVASSGF